ncbi:MAG: sigma-54-dependent Fis family transcriptional regulator [Candidatus Eisenbacteria sp.]|nr:sigma-54-dependent Fis family transcriptional regulator [Candidatus Eisenbacteria bacterium]
MSASSNRGAPGILVVDDEAGIRASLKGVLSDEGYRVIEAADAETALGVLDEESPDLILLDVLLPGMDGVAFLAQLKGKGVDTPVIMMSGHATIDTAVKATRLGAYDFLEKPLEPQRLTLSIHNALEAQSLRQENVDLQTRVKSTSVMIGDSEPMRMLYRQIAKAAPSTGRVLIMGESGTGKELVARAIHDNSNRSDGPFIKVNCAAIPRDLIESELFGHEKGAFTGADRQRRGRFELAHMGTILLDEIGDMSLETQAKLLRVLEENEIERVGGGQPISIDVRMISATNKDLKKEIEDGNFRDDLYYRVSVIPISVPPLRKRRKDIPALARHLLDMYSQEDEALAKTLMPGAIARLQQMDWPGNVRQLRNAIERLVIMTEDAEIGAEHIAELQDEAISSAPCAKSLRTAVESYEKDLIVQALESAGWNVAEAARALNTDRANLHRKMRRYGVEKPKG